MKAFFAVIVLCIGTISFGADLHEQVKAEVTPKITKLNHDYIEKLQSLFTKFKDSARLDDAILSRKLWRLLEEKGGFAQADVVTVPIEIREVQTDYLLNRQLIVNRAIDQVASGVTQEILKLTSADKLEQAASLQKEMESTKLDFGYIETSQVTVKATALPEKVMMTQDSQIIINLVGQSNSVITLRKGEVYPLLGIISESVIVDLKGDRVKVPIERTDAVARVERLKKGQKEDVPAPVAVDDDQPKSDSATMPLAPFQTWEIRRPYGNSDINFVGPTVKLFNRGTLISKKPFRKFRLRGSGSFGSSSDVLDLYFRARKIFTNPFGAPDYGITIHFDFPNNQITVLSWQYGGSGAQTLFQMPYQFRVAQEIGCEILDDGNTIALKIDENEVWHGKSSMRGDYLIVQNREGGGHQFTFSALGIDSI